MAESASALLSRQQRPKPAAAPAVFWMSLETSTSASPSTLEAVLSSAARSKSSRAIWWERGGNSSTSTPASLATTARSASLRTTPRGWVERTRWIFDGASAQARRRRRARQVHLRMIRQLDRYRGGRGKVGQRRRQYGRGLDGHDIRYRVFLYKNVQRTTKRTIYNDVLFMLFFRIYRYNNETSIK